MERRKSEDLSSTGNCAILNKSLFFLAYKISQLQDLRDTPTLSPSPGSISTLPYMVLVSISKILLLTSLHLPGLPG